MSKSHHGKTTIQSLERGLAILESVASSTTSTGVRELAREINLTPTSVHRYLVTLREAHYLEQDPETGRYRLGPRVLELSTAYALQNPIVEVAYRLFEKYSEQFEYNFYYGVLSGDEATYVSVLDGRGPVKVVEVPGGSSMLHATALGKILLAYQDDDFITNYLGRGTLRRYTERTLTSPEQIRDLIPQIRRDGYAINDGEEFDEIAAIAAPVHNHMNKTRIIGSVALAYPRGLVGKKRTKEIIVLVKKIAHELGERSSG